MSWVSCYGCNGRGWNERVRSYTCPRCNGERTIARIHQNPPAQGRFAPRTGEIVYETCPQCGGIGEVTHYYQETCKVCRGAQGWYQR